MRKLLCMVLSVQMTVTLIGGSLVCAKEERGGDILSKYYSMKNEAVYEDEAELSTAREKYAKIKKVLKKKDKKNMNCYSGSYIDDDNNLVVATNNKKKLKDEGVVADRFEKVEFSYEELQNTYDELNKYVESNKKEILDENNNDIDNLTGFNVSVQDNKVIVEVLDINNTSSIEAIKNAVSNVDCLEIVEVEKTDENATTLKLGRKVFVCRKDKKSGSYLSIGIKAYYINSKGEKVHGFITAAHGTKETGEYVYLTNNISNAAIGQVVKRKYSGKVDAAFVKLTNRNYTLSRQAYYSNSKGSTSGGPTMSYKLYTSLYDGAIGDSVYKVGYKTYLTKGKLLSDSATKVASGSSTGSIKDMYKSSYKADHGDSGGTVYYHDEDGNQYLGIHHGRVTYTNGTEDAYAVKWDNIDDAWNITFEK